MSAKLTFRAYYKKLLSIFTISEAENDGGIVSFSLNREEGVFDFEIENYEEDEDGKYFSATNGRGYLTWHERYGSFIGNLDLGYKKYSFFPFGKDKIAIMLNKKNPDDKTTCIHDFMEKEHRGETEMGKERAVTDRCDGTNCGDATVDVLMLITPAAQAYLDANFGMWGPLLLYQDTYLINIAFANSGMSGKSVRVRHLHFDAVANGVNITTSSASISINSFNNNSAVNQLKSLYRADVMVLLTNVGPYSITSGGGGTATGITRGDAFSSSNKSSIVEVSGIPVFNFVFAHEMGHQFLADHNNTSVPSISGTNCAQGMFLAPTAAVGAPRTIMAIKNPNVAADFVTGTRVAFFSTPNKTYAPTGVLMGSTNLHNNTGVIEETICEVANHMSSPTWSVKIDASMVNGYRKLAANVLAPAPVGTGVIPAEIYFGFPPYTYEWKYSISGVTNGYVFSSAASSITVNPLPPKNTYYNLKVTSSDGYVRNLTYFIKGNSHKSQGGGQGDIYFGTENAKKYFSITPNPIMDNFQLNFSSSFKGETIDNVEIWDNFGKKVKSFKDVRNETVFETNDFMNGIYFIRLLHQGNLIESQKVIIQK